MPEIKEEIKSVPIANPYIHPYGSLFPPFHHPFATPYTHPYGYVVNPGSTTLKATEFPYIWQHPESVVEAVGKSEAEAEASPAEEKTRRRRRSADTVRIPLPYLHAVPTVAKTTFQTKQYDPVEAATPADTTKLEITTKEHELTLPAIEYAQPVVEYKPVTYKVAAPSPLTYALPSLPHFGFPYTYAALAAPVVKLDE